MNDFKQRFSDCTSEYLLQLRARGDDLVEDAHRAIESILIERGEKLPPRPITLEVLKEHQNQQSKFTKLVKSLVTWVLGFLVFMTVYGMLWEFGIKIPFIWIEVVGVVSIVLYIGYDWYRSKYLLTEDERKKQKQEFIKQSNELSELMIASAEGNLSLVRELVEFGSDVNRKSVTGGTALMYAVRNNQIDVVRYLLSVGADRSVKSDKKTTALDLAKRNDCEEIIVLLEK